MWNKLLGQAQNANIGGMGAANAAYSGMSQSQLVAQQYNTYLAQRTTAQMQIHPAHKWMFDGEYMDFMDFVNRVFPEDSAEKTAFILRHSGEK